MKRVLGVAALGVGLVLAGGAAVQAGAVGGPKVLHTAVLARSTDVYHVSFRAGEMAVVTVIGDGDTDLDLYVYDAFGNLVGSDEDLTDTCVVSFLPPRTGVYTIRVVNRGNVYNNYTITTN
jgi:hypothetical protein